MQSVRLYRLGLVPYREAWDWQRETAAAVREGAPEALAVLQHPPVYTFGRRVRRENLLFEPLDAEVVESDRGGDVTYHGPGQLVAYPILDLRRRGLGAADYVRLLEEVMIRTAAAFGVDAVRIGGRPGVWTAATHPLTSNRASEPGKRGASSTAPLLARRGARGSGGEVAKLGTVGVRVQGGVTTHGLALNVSTDLSRFDAIVPCGLAGITVTSLQRELGHATDFEAAADAFTEAFEAVFESTLAPSAKPAQPPAVQSPSLHCGEGRAAAGVRSEAALGR